MVDLPSIPNAIPELRAPQSRVSPGQIAAPGLEIAANLDKAAGVANDIAVKEARKAGASAVTRDEQGNVQVAPMPFIVGPAAEEYQRVAHQSFVSQTDIKVSEDVAQARIEHEGDPKGFSDWSKAYISKIGSSAPDAETRNAVQVLAQRHVSETANGIALRQNARDVQSGKEVVANQQAQLENEMAALARSGDTTSDNYKSRLAQWDALQQQRINNPLYGYSRDQALYDRNAFLSRMTGDAYVYSIDKVYNDTSTNEKGEANGGYRNAVTAADRILTDPKLNLSQPEREQFYHKAMGEIRANEAIRRQDVREASAAFQELTMASATGARIEPDQVEKVAKSFRDAGDPAGSARVYAQFARKPLNDDFGRQPAGDRAQQIMSIQGANVIKGVAQRLVDLGYSKEAAAGIAGNLAHESGGDPTALGDNRTSVGLAQWHNERATRLRQFAASQGKPATDPMVQADFIDHELRTTEGATLAKLQAAKTPEEAAKAFIDFERPQGWTPENATGAMGYQSRVAFSRQVYNGQPDSVGTPAASAWLTANRQRTSDKASWEEWSTIMKDYNSEGIQPPIGRVHGLIAAARATNNAELLEQIGSDMSRVQVAQDIAQRSPAERHAIISQLEAEGSSGNLTPGHAALLRDLQRRDAAITKGLDDNPISTTVTNFPDRLKTPAPLDLSDPKALAGGLAMRGKIAQFAAQNWGVAPPAALDAADLAQIKAALNNPDPNIKAGIFRAIGAALPEDVRNATLAKIGKGRPDLMISVAAGSMLQPAPDIAESVFRGQAAIAMDKGYMPSKGSEAMSFDQEFDKRIPASTFSLAARTDVSGPYAVAQGMVRARYADLSAQAADTSGKLDTNRLQKAVDDVTGGILDHNGGKLIAPVRGMPQATFDRVMAGVTDADLGNVSTLSGEPVTANYLRNSATLESVGDGRYYVKLGKDPLRPVYAYQGANTEAPQKFMLDLRNRPLGVVPPAEPFVQP